MVRVSTLNIGTVREAKGFMRAVTSIVLVVYCAVTISPPAHAYPMQLAAQLIPGLMSGSTAVVEEEETPDYSREMVEELKKLEKTVKIDGQTEATKQRLHELRRKMLMEESDIAAEFAETEATLRSKKVPAEIMQRHADVTRQFQRSSNALSTELAAIENARQVKSLVAAATHLRKRLEQQPQRRRAQPLPEQLPFAMPSKEIRAPAANSDQIAAVYPPEAVPGLKLASLSPILMAGQAAPTAPEYLAASEEVQITDEIRQLAAGLNNNPVEIFNWVYSNVEFIPSYGSIQGSALTLKTRQGNAMDTASLLIALLRAAQIPARYAHGTVEVPIEQLMNWLGGLPSGQVALDVMAQGGVPIRGLSQGGVIRVARFEHTWVEAYVDFTPSRGARNLAPDSWADLDASFKQHGFIEGMDLTQRPLTLPTEAFNQLMSQVQFDAATGELRGLTTASAQQFRASMMQQIESYMVTAQAELPSPVRDKYVIERVAPVLGASTPYKIVTQVTTATAPAAARRSFRFTLYSSVQDRAYDSPALSFQANLPALANKRLTLQFLPATEADAAALRGFLPTTPDGTVEAGELPDSIPGYLVHLTVRLLLDGAEVGRADGLVLGQEIATSLEIQKLAGDWHVAHNINTAGEFMAISLDLQGAGADPMNWDQTLSPEAMLHAAAEAYWAHADEHLKLLPAVGIAATYRQPSFGVFSSRLDPIYSYGIPRRVSFSGTEVDIDGLLATVVAMDGTDASRISAVQQLGMMASSLESDIPQVYLSSSANAQGASAISAFAAAVLQGQPVYEVTSNNLAAALASIQQSVEVEADIQAAVLAGRTVRATQSPVTIGGWRGTGYIIEDEQTGGAAYRISGGANGGSQPDPLGDALSAVGLGMLNVTIPPSIAGAAEQPCDQDDGNRQHKIDWQTILFWAMIALMIAALIALAAGSGGGAIPVAARALAILIPSFLAVTAAQAATGQCPIFYPGDTAGAGLIVEATAHIASAQAGGSPRVLTYSGVDAQELIDRDWYNYTPECNRAARRAYSVANGGAIGACDEYPPASTVQGGRVNYGPPNNYVSLRLMDSGQNSRIGSVMRWFWAKCGVYKFGRFEVRPSSGATTGTNSQGAQCYP